MAEGTAPCFLKGPREHRAGASPLALVLVILANYWKMVVPPDPPFNNTNIRNNLIALYNGLSKMLITYSQDMYDFD